VSIFGVTREGTPARERIADRTRGFALGRERTKRSFQPASQIVKQRLGASLAYRATKLCGLAAYPVLDNIVDPEESTNILYNQ
jgi:hypothetical protein